MHRKPINFLERETEYVRPRYTRVVFFILITIFLVAVAGCVHTRSEGNGDGLDYDPVTLEPIAPTGFFSKIKHFIFSKDVKLEGQRKDRINILLTGQGGIGHDGPFLTDTIIMASIKPSTGQVAFVSIPRDLYVPIPGHGKRKINHANAFGEANRQGSGPELTKQVVEEVLDEEISYFVRVDFQAFVDVIDAIDGVRVHVDRSFTDYEYPAPNHEYQTISFTKGPQTMDGDTALTFVRSRHGNNGEGSDFARSKRQQKVILALKEKLLSFSTVVNPAKLKGIYDTVSDNIATDMPFSDMIAMLKLSKELEADNIISLTLDNSPTGFLENGTASNGAFILVPSSGSFDEIQDKVEHIFDAPPTITQDNTPKQQEIAKDYSDASVEILNGTWRAGLAARTKQRLSTANFSVDGLGNSVERPVAETTLYVLTKGTDPAIVDALVDTLSISNSDTRLPAGESAASSTDILIILGDDYIE